MQTRAERAAALPRSPQAASQGQRDLRPGLMDFPRRPSRGVRLVPDGLGDRSDHYRRAVAARVAGRSDRRRLCPEPGELCHLACRVRHRQSVWRAGCQPLARQLRRAGLDPGLLHGRSVVALGQPVPREPRARELGGRLCTSERFTSPLWIGRARFASDAAVPPRRPAALLGVLPRALPRARPRIGPAARGRAEAGRSQRQPQRRQAARAHRVPRHGRRQTSSSSSLRSESAARSSPSAASARTPASRREYRRSPSAATPGCGRSCEGTSTSSGSSRHASCRSGRSGRCGRGAPGDTERSPQSFGMLAVAGAARSAWSRSLSRPHARTRAQHPAPAIRSASTRPSG